MSEYVTSSNETRSFKQDPCFPFSSQIVYIRSTPRWMMAATSSRICNCYIKEQGVGKAAFVYKRTFPHKSPLSRPHRLPCKTDEFEETIDISRICEIKTFSRSSNARSMHLSRPPRIRGHLEENIHGKSLQEPSSIGESVPSDLLKRERIARCKTFTCDFVEGLKECPSRLG